VLLLAAVIQEKREEPFAAEEFLRKKTRWLNPNRAEIVSAAE
jgi:hypothetical protein